MKTLANIITHLEDTIQQKQKYLEGQRRDLEVATFAEEIAVRMTVEFLEINIGELSRILADLKSIKEE